jgi:plastocyanin
LNNKIILGIVVIFVVATAGFLFINKGEKEAATPLSTIQPAPTDNSAMMDNVMEATNESMMEDKSMMEEGVKNFTVENNGLSFVPNKLSVKRGEKVSITFKNTGGTHDLVIDELNVKSDLINSGEETTVEFLADKAGEFIYYCSVSGHRSAGMWGTLTVE